MTINKVENNIDPRSDNYDLVYNHELKVSDYDVVPTVICPTIKIV